MLFKPYKLVITVFCLILLAGCFSSINTKLDPDAAAKIKRVGVMSLSAQELNRRYCGLTIFGNEYEHNNISEWNVDDEYEVQMQSALAALAPFETVRLPYERKDFAIYSPNGELNWSVVEERLKNYADKNLLNAVVITVSMRQHANSSGRSCPESNGAGFFAWGYGDVNVKSGLFLGYGVYIVDGKTGKVIAGRIHLQSFVDVAPDLSRVKFKDLSEGKIAEVRKLLIDLPKNQWGPNFKELLATGKK